MLYTYCDNNNDHIPIYIYIYIYTHNVTYIMIIISWVNVLIVFVPSDLQFCRFWIFLRCNVTYFICQLDHMTKMQYPDWFVMCCCLYFHDAGHVLLLSMLFCAFSN